MSESSHTLSMIDRAKRWMRHLRRGSRSSSIGPDEKMAAEMFANAQNCTINGGQFINQFIKDMQVNYINDVVSNRQAVFELLEPYTCLEATKDSSARYPPPKCHPQTRLKIREKLTQWLSNEQAKQKMRWVRGSAGTGKSAVAQSLGDSCEEEGNFGGSYFFSRVAGRNKLENVVPTLVYQLSEAVPEYRSLVGNQLTETPLLLRKSPPVQFRNLIVEPFAALQRQRPRKPTAIILDGLDECDGEDSQRQIIEMITNAIHSNPDLPLRWLIFSRPEAHLKNAFSRNLLCGREELIIDDECRENVEQYVKERLVEIRNAYGDVTPAEWPSPDQLEQLLDAVSGLFVLASTCLNFIANPEGTTPPSCLDSLLAYMARLQTVVSTNPLAALDLLYFQILEKIPSTAYKTTRQLLGYICYRNKFGIMRRLPSAQALSNFYRLDQHTFYNAVRGLHSVMRIPEVENAARFQIQFYHASFHDFLLDPSRSREFAISEQEAILDVIRLVIYWCEVDATHFHTDDGWTYDDDHEHDSLPGLTWVSEDRRLSISRSILDFSRLSVLRSHATMKVDVLNDCVLSQLSDVNFRYWNAWTVILLARFCQPNPSTSLVRVEPSSATDHQLLEYFNRVIGNGIAKPAKFPVTYDLRGRRWIREYFFIGHGVKSVIVWRTSSPSSGGLFYSIRCDQEPSEAQISEYAECLRRIKWDEERAKLEME